MTAATAVHMGFVGVSTAGSSIMTVFPRWAEALNLPTRRLVGHDLPLDATPAQYRALIEQIRSDPQELGALVTTHKIGVYTHCVDLFDELDEFAQLCGEVSSLSKRDGLFLGQAKDPLTAGLALEEFVPPRHFQQTGAQVICLGAGGAGTAASWYLAGRGDQPDKIICTDTDPGRLAHLRTVHVEGGLEPELFTYVQVQGPTDADELIAKAPPGTLVINATGRGKDRPGSPVSDAVRFPSDGLVWELNYRGTLDFLRQAQAQRKQHHLTIVDGWRYFIHGWSQVIAEVFGLTLDLPTVEELSRLAGESR